MYAGNACQVQIQSFRNRFDFTEDTTLMKKEQIAITYSFQLLNVYKCFLEQIPRHAPSIKLDSGILGTMSQMRILMEGVTGLSVEKGWKFKCVKLLCSDKMFFMESFAQSR